MILAFWEVMGNPKGRTSTLPAKPSFSHFFGPMGLGETLAFFFAFLGSDGKSIRKKTYMVCKTKFFTFFWAYGPRVNSRDFFFSGVLGSDGKSKRKKTHIACKTKFFRFFLGLWA